MIYLDYAATTHMSQEALDAYYETASNYYGNTASLHEIGTVAQDLLQMARSTLARAIGDFDDTVYFTGGGSEANYLALTSLAFGQQSKGKHIVTSPHEHHSVKQTLAYLESVGFEISMIPIDEAGQITPETLTSVLRPDTILATIAHGSSELGIIQPLEVLGPLLSTHGVLLHADCVQTFGKLPIDVSTMNITALSLSAHKVHGPKGVGALYLNPKVKATPLLQGSTHEGGVRHGTVNTPGAVSFATAASNVIQGMVKWKDHVEGLKELFLCETAHLKGMVVEGTPHTTLPHYVPLRFKGIEGQYMMLELNRRGIAVSTGSACKAGYHTPPASLLALGRSVSEAHELLRVTFGLATTADDIRQLCTALSHISEHYYTLTTLERL
ncbi:cysteine desulfurase [Fictibacillus macauensis ZFHKF-1]|uniref:Cysteine desulfurase n=1 Tax=Fictibacillus macauensis ZFHKF-1 TaxID=1196324 RepID=I8AHW8_9BACL|nr:IscS subfamily cysteine desulfurase [Fictibacillus macauensis]EIT85327.1 cysteine desulfurase [Fictibacillus macauensis ZFHKF-1]